MRVQSSKFKVHQSREKVQSSKFKSQSKIHFELCTLHSELKGYTLIEVLVALAVLIIGFSALTTMTNRARRAAIAAEELSTVQLACQTRVNEMLAGVRPFAPTFNEPVTGLDAWFLTVELYPAPKPGITAVRAQMSRQYLPGDTQERLAGTDFFEITHWVNNMRLDPELVQAMQRNPFALTAAAMMPNPQNAMPGMMGGMMPPRMTGATSLTDRLAGTMPMGGMGGDGFAGGMMSSGAMPDVPPPFSLGNETGPQRSQDRETFSQRTPPGVTSGLDPLVMGLPDIPPPIDIPLADPLVVTTMATSVTESPPTEETSDESTDESTEESSTTDDSESETNDETEAGDDSPHEETEEEES